MAAVRTTPLYLDIHGRNIDANAVVTWNGERLQAFLFSSEEVEVVVDPIRLTSPQVASIAILNPGGSSAESDYVVRADLTVHVDDDAPGDPGPEDPKVSDPLEDGSALHPFDRVQEGLDHSLGGDTVLVAAGDYYESVVNRFYDSVHNDEATLT